MFGLGVGELVLLVLVLLLLFGATRIPEIAKGLGSGIRTFKTELKRPDGEEDEDGKPRELVGTRDAEPRPHPLESEPRAEPARPGPRAPADEARPATEGSPGSPHPGPDDSERGDRRRD